MFVVATATLHAADDDDDGDCDDDDDDDEVLGEFVVHPPTAGR